jgi:hypothetical protein
MLNMNQQHSLTHVLYNLDKNWTDLNIKSFVLKYWSNFGAYP